MNKRIKTPTVYQMEVSECGAASLSMVLGYYSLFLPMEQLRAECAISKDGSKANNILRAARLHGLVASGYKKDVKELKSIVLPAILFWEFNHFVVLEGIGNKQFYINDPAYGHRVVSASEFEKSFTGIVLEFKLGPDFKPAGEKPSGFRFLYRHLKDVKSVVVYMVIASLICSLFFLAFPGSVHFFVNAYLVDKLSENINHLVLFILLIAIFMSFLFLLTEKLIFYLNQIFMKMSGSNFYRHILRLPIEFFSLRYASDIGNRLQNCFLLSRAMISLMNEFIFNVCLIVIFSIVIVFYDVKLAVIFLFVFLANAFVFKLLSQRAKDINSKIIAEKNRVLSTIMFALGNIEDLKAQGAESEFFTRFVGFRAKKINAQNAYINHFAFVDSASSFLLMLAFVALFLSGSIEVFKGDLSQAKLMVCFVLVGTIVYPLNKIFALLHRLSELNVEQERINDVKNYQIDNNFLKTDLSDLSKLSGAIQIKNLSFSYDRFGGKEPTIADFNLEAKPGSRIAIVGASGSGKSTIAKLICGLYAPLEGQILFDGINRKNISQEVLSKCLGYVEQDIFLFSGTIWDNLTLFSPHLSSHDVEKALKDALIDEDIKSILEGFEGIVEEGGRNLSGGEKQRLEIARALILNPSVIVLDECMSALDSYTEKKIDNNLKSRNITCIFIAHRLSTIRDCDEIIVLDAGRIVQRGKHEELIKEEGIYKKLISSN